MKNSSHFISSVGDNVIKVCGMISSRESVLPPFQTLLKAVTLITSKIPRNKEMSRNFSIADWEIGNTKSFLEMFDLPRKVHRIYHTFLLIKETVCMISENRQRSKPISSIHMTLLTGCLSHLIIKDYLSIK